MKNKINGAVVMKQRNEEKYYLDPKLCITCKSIIPYEKRRQKNCSLSCSAESSSNLARLNYQKSLNRTQPEMKFICLCCDSEITDIKFRNRKYCSVKCQGLFSKLSSDKKVENGLGTHLQIKRYIIEKRGYKCEYCNASTFNSKITNYQDVPINLELEHKDGNPENHTLDNCVIICPTCHSFTPTYKGKNKGNGRAARRQRYQDGKSY